MPIGHLDGRRPKLLAWHAFRRAARARMVKTSRRTSRIFPLGKVQTCVDVGLVIPVISFATYVDDSPSSCPLPIGGEDEIEVAKRSDHDNVTHRFVRPFRALRHRPPPDGGLLHARDRPARER